MAYKRLGDLLIAAGTITPEELEPYRQSILDRARLTPLTLTRWKRFSFKWLHGLDWKEPRK